MALPGLLDAAERDACGTPGVFGRHAAALALVLEQRDMRGELP